jgi:hypothetical protein
LGALTDKTLRQNLTIAGTLAGAISSNGCLRYQEGRGILRTRTERPQFEKLGRTGDF